MFRFCRPFSILRLPLAVPFLVVAVLALRAVEAGFGVELGGAPAIVGEQASPDDDPASPDRELPADDETPATGVSGTRPAPRVLDAAIGAHDDLLPPAAVFAASDFPGRQLLVERIALVPHPLPPPCPRARGNDGHGDVLGSTARVRSRSAPRAPPAC